MILAALNDYYQRLLEQEDSEIAPFGYSQEKISYALILGPEGELLDVQDIRDTSGKKPLPAGLVVPQPEKRTSGIKSNFLWDKTSYVLGVSSKVGERVAQEHDDFKQSHLEALKSETDPGLLAVVGFLNKWKPESFSTCGYFSEEHLDANLVFRLDGERAYIHQRPAAMSVRARLLDSQESRTAECLVTGKILPVARLHPSIKGVNGAQSSGASIVSFNLDSFKSYGKEQGENAPVSEQVAFAYTTVLNHLLRRGDDNRQRLQIGDSTVVFWAQAATRQKAQAAESLFADFLQPPATDGSETARLHAALDKVVQGRPLSEVDAELQDDTRIFILGLSPNASRISIRFWETGSLMQFSRRLAQHYEDMMLKPLPWKTPPAIWRLLHETVPHRDNSRPSSDDIAPLLAGEMARSILTGRRYPQSLLTNLIMRFRADGDISSLRVALCKAVLARDLRLGVKSDNKEIPVSLDTENADPGYLLGRMFATLENIQRNALGKNVNATIRDRFYGAASATPASVFPVLIRNAQNHLGRLRKDKRGIAVNLEKQLGEIMEKLATEFPKSLRIEAQGRFAIGYYHQTSAHFGKSESNDQEGEE